RWEMAIAVSPGCNARCVGCISKQEEEGLVSPQDRLTFIPNVDEIVEVAVPHLEIAEEAIVSFGQGCEGEPLLQWRRIEQAINLLCFPGMIDREREVEALLSFVRETGLRLIQLRNLNIDPEVLLPRMPVLDSMGQALGMRTVLKILKREVPEVEIGNFSRPV